VGESLAERYYSILIGGQDRLSGVVARVDDPRAGRVEGDRALDAFFQAGRAWLAERQARYETGPVTRGAGRTVAEGVLHLADAGRLIPLPVAVVEAGGAASERPALRVYHSLWPLYGRHTVRPPLLPSDPGLSLAPVMQAYQDALAAGDVEGILAAYEPDGCAREPSGAAYVHCGTNALRAFYSALFANGGGIPLEHCTATDDGTRCAVEYTVVRLGRSTVPPQAGIAVYERGPSGRLREARIYDDVDVA
jgi:hypothetical protein